MSPHNDDPLRSMRWPERWPGGLSGLSVLLRAGPCLRRPNPRTLPAWFSLGITMNHSHSHGNPWEIHGFPIRKWSENGMDHGFTRHKHLRFMDGLSGKMWKVIFQPTHGVQGSDDGCWPMSEARSVLARCDATPVLFVVGRGLPSFCP
jgi:hypothetical protein